MGQCLCRGRKSSSTPNAAKRSVVRSREVNSGNMDSKSVSQDEVKIRERAKAAVMGAFVADAATMGLHWVYSVNQIKNYLDNAKADVPEFFSPSSGPFYKYPTGSASPYGEEVAAVLESVVEAGGVNGQHMAMNISYIADKTSGYLNSATKKLAANLKNGMVFPEAAPVDDQANGMTKVPIVVARYAGKPDFTKKLIEAVKTHQNGESAQVSVLAIGLILEKVVLGSSIRDAVADAQQSREFPPMAETWVESALSTDTPSIQSGVGTLGQSCHLPGSFASSLYIVEKSASYVDAVRSNIISGGDNCSRSFVVGSLFGAQDGIQAIPKEWIAKTTRYKQLEKLVDSVLANRDAN